MASAVRDRLRAFVHTSGEVDQQTLEKDYEAEGIDLAAFAAGIDGSRPDAAARADLLLMFADHATSSCPPGVADDGTSGSWHGGQNDGAGFERLQALALLRQLLVLTRQSPGPAGLLSNTAAVDALQEVLPFAPLLQLAAHNVAAQGSAGPIAQALGGPGDPRNQNLLFMLPPAQRAWLLADAAAAVLLPGGRGRSELPNSPQHCAALLLLLHSFHPPADTDRPSGDSGTIAGSGARTSLQSCLASMGAAALQQLEQQGHRLEQQRQELPQLQQQLARLATACQKERPPPQQQQQRAQGSSGLQQGRHMLNAPRAAELLGIGNLQQLLLLEQQQKLEGRQQKQQQQQHVLEEGMHRFLQQLQQLPDKQPLGLQQLQMLQDCLRGCMTPDLVLACFNAQAHAYAVHGTRCPASWEMQRMQQLLQQQAGLTAQQADELVHRCFDLQVTFAGAEKMSAAGAAKEEEVQRYRVIVKAPGSAISSSSSSSSAATLQPSITAGLAVSWCSIDVSERLAAIDKVQGQGALLWLNFMPTLVRSTLGDLPGQRQQQQQQEEEGSAQDSVAAAAAGVGTAGNCYHNSSSSSSGSSSAPSAVSRQQLRNQLLARSQVLQQLRMVLAVSEELQQKLSAAAPDAAASMVQQRLQQVLQLTLRLPEAAADACAAGLSAFCQQRQYLLEMVQVGCGVSPGDANWTAADSNSHAVRVRLAAAAVLADVFDFETVMHVLLGHTSTAQAGMRDCSSSSTARSSSCSSSQEMSPVAAAAPAPAASAPAAGQAGQLLPSLIDLKSLSWLLDAVETYLCQCCSIVMHEASAVQSDAATGCSWDAAVRCGRAAEDLRQLLGQPDLKGKQWVQQYEQNSSRIGQVQSTFSELLQRMQLACREMEGLVAVAGALINSAQAAGGLVQLLQAKLGAWQVQRDAAASTSSEHQQQHNTPGSSSGSSCAKGRTPSEPASTAELRPAGVAAHKQVLQRLDKLAAAVAAAGSLAEHARRVAVADKAARKVAHAAGRAAHNASSGSSSSNSSGDRCQTLKLFDAVVAVCGTSQELHSQLSAAAGPVAAIGRAAAAVGLGLVSALGLWEPTAAPPADPCSSGNVTHQAGSRSAAGVDDCTAGDGKQRTTCSSSSTRARNAGGCDGEGGEATLLLQWAAALQQHGAAGCDSLEQVLHSLGCINDSTAHATDHPHSSSSSSSSSSWRGREPYARVSGRQCYDLARCRLAQVEQQLLLPKASAGSAAAYGTSSSGNSGTDLAALVAAVDAGSSSSSTAAGGPNRHSSFDGPLWRLLCACKPSVAQALCCFMIPAACRSYEAFERAMLGWPPQPAADAAADAAAATSAQRARNASDQTSSSRCICGEEGQQYVVVEQAHAQAAGLGGFSDLVLRMDRPAVCAKPSCVARELRWLAQQGKPCEVRRELLGTALQALRTDWLVLPAAYRALVPPCKRDARGPDTLQLQQLYARALQLSFCKMGPAAVSGLVRRLLLLEAVQQPVPWSFLAPALCILWQQQQHLDLEHVACSSSGTCSDGSSCSSTLGWLPQLAATLLQPLLLPTVSQALTSAAMQVVNIIWPEQGCFDTAAAAAAEAAMDQHPGNAAGSVLCCLAAPGCRVALSCWVLTWHACLVQQGGDYSSAHSRAAAAEAASDLLGPELLACIRLPGWADILPAAPPGAAAADNAEQQQQQQQPPCRASVWWIGSSSTTSSSIAPSGSSSGMLRNAGPTNQKRLKRLSQPGGADKDWSSL
ncbi:hypothetical protein COO60DRAFT_1694207 [Scenedesmus sp. NREL 46B-D3]|nr:hypothetical protein COO60DRAFT_1694207 [Scenedesmus sp. NREL 46B-D3]